MMKLFDSENKEILFEESFLVGEQTSPLIKELLNREDYTSYSFSINDSEEKISMSDVFVLQINIKDSSSVYSAFKLEKFPKDEIINKIALLKDIVINDIESSKHKTLELFKILSEYHPYFVIYQSKNGIPLLKEEVSTLVNDSNLNEVTFIYLDRVLSTFGETPSIETKEEKAEEPTVQEEQVVEEKETKVEETPVVSEEKIEEAPIEIKEEAPKKEKKKIDFKKYVVMDIGDIKKNKYHCIFLTVSSFLFGFASSVEFCNALIGKGISALFFVCAGVGMFLNTYVYIDYFKERKIKDRLFIYSILFNLIGYGLSLGATFIFYSMDRGEIKNGVNSITLIWVSVVMSVVMIILSILIALLVDCIDKKIKAKKAKENA